SILKAGVLSIGLAVESLGFRKSSAVKIDISQRVQRISFVGARPLIFAKRLCRAFQVAGVRLRVSKIVEQAWVAGLRIERLPVVIDRRRIAPGCLSSIAQVAEEAGVVGSQAGERG